MKRISKWLLLFSILMFVFVALVACGETQKTTKPTKTNSYKDSEIYQVYLAYAENGGTLSYDEWYASIKGEKGDKGDKGDDGLTPYIGDNGNWWIGEEDTGTKAGSGSGKDVFFTGKCGEKTTWTMYVDGSLSISGTGRVTSTPWDRFSDLIYKTTIKKGIENIPNNTFSQYVNIIEIIISDSVTSIGNSAFSGCSSLTSVTIPDSVTSIGDDAFSGCSSLTSVTIGNGVTSIGDDAFSGCSSLTSVTIGNGVTSIGKNAFDDCSSLTSVYYTGDIASWCGIWFSDNPLSYAHNLYINNELIKDIVIPDTVTKIGYQFTGWNGTSITIGNGVTSIGSYAFSGCTATIAWEKNPAITTIGTLAFSDYNGTSITIPDSVKSIGEYAFSGCSSLTSITIPDSVTSIGRSAFWCCYHLVEVYNKSSLNIEKGSTANGYVGYYAKAIYTEEYTSKLSTDSNGYVIYTDGEEKSLIMYTGEETELTLPEGITEINRYAFYENNKITSIIIPDSVTSIGEYAFENCSSLTSITIPNSVTIIGKRAFSYCRSLKSITIPASVTSIGEGVFFYCSSLTSITFQGTKAQWNAISKGSGWNNNTGIYTVHCTDGDIEK